MKEILAAILAVMLAISGGGQGSAATVRGSQLLGKGVVMYIGSPRCYVEGEEKQIDSENTAVTPYLKEGRTYVPVRFAAEAFGGEVSWDENSQTAKIITPQGEISFTVGEKEIRRGSQTLAMDGAAEIKGSRVCVPVKYMGEALGNQVFYERGLIVISEDAQSLDPDKDKAAINQAIGVFTGIKTVDTEEKLIELIGFDPKEEPSYGVMTEDMIQYSPQATGVPALGSADLKNAEAEAVNTGFEGDFSQTNVQVQGVDEADVIKTDGEYVYYLNPSTQEMDIIKANKDGSMEKMSRMVLRPVTEAYKNWSFAPVTFYLDQDRLVVIGSLINTGNGEMNIDKEAMEVRDSLFGWSDSFLQVIDIKDRKVPQVEKEVLASGEYRDSRKIGDSVYLITNKIIGYGHKSYLPYLFDSKETQTQKDISLDNVYYFPFPGIKNNVFTVISGINIADSQEAVKTTTFLGCGDNLYMSGQSLYIAGQSYDHNGANTDIYKFNAGGGEIVFSQKGSVPGTILNQFSMDEHKNYFRIATNSFNRMMVNHLYVLDAHMEIVGREENIAPGEKIYSVRFMGDRAYMVTFRQTDPLFAIDLSKPESPKVMGVLKIPGYSSYLHPYDENHLIGIGRDVALDGDVPVEQGLKLSMFDVSDITSPKEMFTEIIGGRGTFSEILTNHKALLFSREKELLAIPVEVYDKNEGKNLWNNGKFKFAGAYVYRINLNSGFVKRGDITHLNTSDLLKASDFGGDYNRYIQRIIYIGDRLYTVSPSMIQCNDMKTMQELGGLEFNK